MRVLRRHDLVWPSASGWQDQLLQQASDAAAAQCLAHWFAQRLPLVVARQTPGDSTLALGLAAPLRWDKRKLALKLAPSQVLYHDRFPKAADIRVLLPCRQRDAWTELTGDLSSLGTDPRVHGSYGWQRISALGYVTAQSDIDLQLAVADADAADSVAGLLERFHWSGPRIDAELAFPGGDAVAWREWLQWRRGTVNRILVKRLHGVALEHGAPWLTERPAVAT